MPFLLALVFVVLPILELAVLIQVGQEIGVLPTILLVIGISVAGGILAKREGLSVWNAFRNAIARGEIPSKEILDGVLVIFGSALLLTPGFITDFLGIFLLVPASRTVIRRAVTRAGGWLALKRFPFLAPLGLVRARRVRARTVPTETTEYPEPPADPERIPGR